MKNNDKRLFWTVFIIILAVLLIFYLIGQNPSVPDTTEIKTIVYPDIFKGILIEMNIANDKLTFFESKLVDGYPDYLPGAYPFVAKLISDDGKLVAEYGFKDPRIILGEQGYTSSTWIDNVNFTLTLPYFNSSKLIDIYSTTELMLSIDISEINEIKTCEDSDGGVNYYMKGFANPCLCSEEPCPSCGSWIDYCLNETTLLEYSCENLNGEQYNCPNGCENGACNTTTSDISFCQTDSDCVPASCCHPTDVVNRANAPDCTNIFCTEECQENTMDCGCGEPVCVNNQCEVAWTGNYDWCSNLE